MCVHAKAKNRLNKGNEYIEHSRQMCVRETFLREEEKKEILFSGFSGSLLVISLQQQSELIQIYYMIRAT